MNASTLRIYHRLQVAAHAVQKVADRVVGDAAELTTAQTAVLSVVAAGDDVTQRQVAVALRLNESAMTAMVSRLLGLGLLDRVRSKTDSRAWSLRLSKTGRASLTAARGAFGTVNARIEDTLAPREIKQLADLLDRLTAAFPNEGRLP
jgi:DNA-binding MarR family transcriptional regulator